jgi:hypothetical protein
MMVDDTATNQYRHRRHSSVNDETLRDDISQYLVRGTTGHAEVLDPSEPAQCCIVEEG